MSCSINFFIESLQKCNRDIYNSIIVNVRFIYLEIKSKIVKKFKEHPHLINNICVNDMFEFASNSTDLNSIFIFDWNTRICKKNFAAHKFAEIFSQHKFSKFAKLFWNFEIVAILKIVFCRFFTNCVRAIKKTITTSHTTMYHFNIANKSFLYMRS